MSSYNGSECMGLKYSLAETRVVLSSGITKVGISKSQVDPCGFCSLRVKANLILCFQCGKLINGCCC